MFTVTLLTVGKKAVISHECCNLRDCVISSDMSYVCHVFLGSYFPVFSD